jgi:hypothetical protein
MDERDSFLNQPPRVRQRLRRMAGDRRGLFARRPSPFTLPWLRILTSMSFYIKLEENAS